MAELLLKIGDQPDPTGYKDGDIICAFNQRRIRRSHADQICHIKQTLFNGDGLNVNGVARKYQELTYQYKFERVSQTEIKRTLLSNMSEEILGNTPNINGEAIDVSQYIKNRLNHSNHKIFGTAGNEYWYGGRTDDSDTVMDDVWNMIETDTPKREIDHTQWFLSDREKQVFLGLGTDDFTDVESASFVEVEHKDIDGKMVLQKKRRRWVDWQALSLGSSKGDIQNQGKSIDVRSPISISKASNIFTKDLS